MTGEHKAAAPAAIEPPSPTSIADNDVARAIDLVARVKREFFSPRATGGALYYPAFGLGTFPNFRAALASIGYPQEDEGWAVEHDGGAVTIAMRGFADFCCLILPQAAEAVSVAFLFGAGFDRHDDAEAEAARCAADGWPEPGAADRWGVICRTRGALQ